MKTANKIITVIITLLSISVFALYGSLFFHGGFTGTCRTVAIVVFACLVSAMIYTGYKRISEIEKEDKDDFSKY
ncbi:MAG: hypothetical protein C0604_09170 [Clostridiales bacterium]|nr:MAG: hypothetical protein C0604_09170 [Clostridiales bacterium]